MSKKKSDIKKHKQKKVYQNIINIYVKHNNFFEKCKKNNRKTLISIILISVFL